MDLRSRIPFTTILIIVMMCSNASHGTQRNRPSSSGNNAASALFSQAVATGWDRAKEGLSHLLDQNAPVLSQIVNPHLQPSSQVNSHATSSPPFRTHAPLASPSHSASRPAVVASTPNTRQEGDMNIVIKVPERLKPVIANIAEQFLGGVKPTNPDHLPAASNSHNRPPQAGNVASMGSNLSPSHSGYRPGSSQGRPNGIPSGSSLGQNTGSGYGSGSSNGYGSSSGSGYGSNSGGGYGSNTGSGYGSNTGSGYGSNTGSNSGYGSGAQSGYGSNQGPGYGSQSGSGHNSGSASRPVTTDATWTDLYPDLCGLEEGTKIIGGHDADPKKWKWMAGLIKGRGNQRSFCGGAIITDRHILTAAHCLVKVAPNDIVVRVGEYDFSDSVQDGEDYEVQNFKIHARYDTNNQENDIALITLRRAIPFDGLIKPVCMPQRNRDYANQIATVIGWGATAYTGSGSNRLKQVSLPIWTKQDCAGVFGIKVQGKSMICAGLKEGGKDSCQGDSGGPLMVQGPKLRWMIVGIVSWGIKCGSPGYPGVYTQVSDYIDWIHDNVRD